MVRTCLDPKGVQKNECPVQAFLALPKTGPRHPCCCALRECPAHVQICRPNESCHILERIRVRGCGQID